MYMPKLKLGFFYRLAMFEHYLKWLTTLTLAPKAEGWDSSPCSGSISMNHSITRPRCKIGAWPIEFLHNSNFASKLDKFA